MKKSSYLLFLLILVAWPLAVGAHDFSRNDSLFFNANNGLYRQRTPSRPWQLVSLPDQAIIKQSVSFDNQIWLVVEIVSKQYLYRQSRSLNFTVVDAVAPAAQIVLKLTGSNLLAISQNQTDVGLTVFRSGDQFEPIVPSLMNTASDRERVIESNGDLLYLQQSGQQVIIFQDRHGWQQITKINCDRSRLIVGAIIGLYCKDGTVWQKLATDRWLPLTLPLVRELYSSDEILAGYDTLDGNLFHLWRSGETTDIQLPSLSATEVEAAVINGSRVLLKKIAGNWRELLWQTDTPKLVELTETASGIVIPVIGSNSLMINGSSAQTSSVAGLWQLATVTGAFGAARQTPLGILIWNPGSLTQFTPTGSTVFSKVNPWSSTTSPLQAIEIGPTASFVSVVTQSGNGTVNLYKTTDYTHWSRVTLPTKPTVAPTIGQARQLVVGSLVELAGVITVGPKVVDSEAIYLEDETAGIQIYLNQANGFLPTTAKVTAVATGEISSSQTKRVLLNSLADLELGSPASWSPPVIGPDEVSSRLGQSVSLRGDVDSIENDYLSMRQLAGTLKLHFSDAKTNFQKDDQLLVPAVIDFNSASGKNEAWALSASYQLLSRVQTASSPAPISSADTEVPSPAPKKAVAARKTTVPVTATVSLPPATVAVAKPADSPVIIASAQSNQKTNDYQTVSMSFVSLITGILSFRGRRFRRFLPD